LKSDKNHPRKNIMKPIHWLHQALHTPVEKVAVSYLKSHVNLHKPPVGVMHTTEVSFDSALKGFKKKNAPHFLVGANRIVQFGPLGIMSHALEHKTGTVETNRWARVQIEVAGFSQLDLWQPDDATFVALASLVAVLEDAAGIPLTRNWPDQLDKSKVWAKESNPRRKEHVWGKKAGWFGHIEVPGNSHWDPGSLNYTALFAKAKALKDALTRGHGVQRGSHKGF
jgi:hypothetical protein